MEIFIEAESFQDRGGWTVDQQSMEVLGSAYLMAHGMGVPVADANTEIFIEDGGRYEVFAYTRDWTSVWNVRDSAGKFLVKIDGTALEQTLGTNGKDWSWQKAGEIELSKGRHTLSLTDLTGFNGRVDAIYLTNEGLAPKNGVEEMEKLRRRLNWKQVIASEEQFDLIVVGGGIAGICTALSARRSGVKTLLINDRPVLGGCNSSEIRVCQGGVANLPPYEKIGNVVKEIAPVQGTPSVYQAEYFEDFRKSAVFETEATFKRYAPCKILYNERVTDVVRDGNKILAVVCTNTLTGKKSSYTGTLFSDCSGDATLARLMGAEVMYGREAESEYGETLAPKTAEKLVMGHSVRWYSEETDKEELFPKLDWNMSFTDENCLDVVNGDWEQETGFTRDMVSEIEYIRDYGLRAIYSNWSYQKHDFKDKEKYKNRRLVWASALGGKRESYRVKGDLVLTQRDIEESVIYDDATSCMTWSIDMHFPEKYNAEEFGEAFRSFAYHRGIVQAYPVPYRCLYAKDVENLFLGGRIVSTSHVAFSAVRVMRTLGQLGEVVGLASSVCKQFLCTPREVYSSHLEDLKTKLREGVDIPSAFECAVGTEEAYHFKDLGWFWIDRFKCPEDPKSLEKLKANLENLGIAHKYPLPDELK